MTKDSLDYGKNCIGFFGAVAGYTCFLLDENKDRLWFNWEGYWKKKVSYVIRFMPVIMTSFPVFSPFIISTDKEEQM